MKELGLNEVRKEYLDYFREKDHNILKSFSLIPQDDKSLLLVNAGMAPLKKYFTGELKMAKNKAASSQRCIRTGDIESVGKTERHGTFFEMLGNFSFGDYFKKEAIQWAWEFLNKNMEIPEDLLWVSVYEEDNEAFDLWKDFIGIPKSKIVRLGKEDNFWELDEGPCGPCSEIYVDRGIERGCGNPDCKPGCDCDRFLEVWNLVFTQFNKDSEGNYTPLDHPNIDTGMGLERLTMVLENADNIFEIKLIKDIITEIEKKSNIKYKSNDKNDISIRIIADHVRAITFLVFDGIIPSNEGRGYVLRRLLRRASRHGKLLGIKNNFLTDLSMKVMEVYSSEYPELLEDSNRIVTIIDAEEKKFQETIYQGLSMLEKIISKYETEELKKIEGIEAFKLYDTYGFPIDLTIEILEENNLKIDINEFNQLMKKQRDRSRISRHEDNIGWSNEINEEITNLNKTKFLGYENLTSKATILNIFVDGKQVSEITKGQKGIIVTDKTTFYGEGGGQIGDNGLIIGINGNNKAIVVKATKNKNEAILHNIYVESGSFKLNEEIELIVDFENRRETMKNHTATHLLHKALKETLGNHVNQAGSYVGPDRLRFDVTHYEAISKEDLLIIQDKVNHIISLGLPVKHLEMSLEESEKLEAIGLFEDKYKEVVRVITIGDKYSTELCGGTHVNSTADLQMFKILSESSVAAGVRRIEAITGTNVYGYLKENEVLIDSLINNLKVDKEELLHRIQIIQKELKETEKELIFFKEKDSKKDIESILKNVEEVDSIKYLTYQANNLDMNTFRSLGDSLRDRIGSGVIVLSNVNGDKLNFLALVSKDLIGKNISAGEIVKHVSKLTGGNGGGRKDFAMAGGKDIDKIELALNSVGELLKNFLS